MNLNQPVWRHMMSTLVILTVFSCQSGNRDQMPVENHQNVPSWVNGMWQTHGELIDAQFEFREAIYSFSHDKSGYRYTKKIANDSIQQLDILTEDQFLRIVNGDTLDLTTKESDAAAASLNSVIYFVCLPQKLKDPAARLKEMETTTMNQQPYHVLHVSFREEGGGTDFEDEFMYWINHNTGMMDYFAYRYHVNGGGVRFRSAYNRRKVQGMIFQDYVNYEVPLETNLMDIPDLYEKGHLKELSRIENKNIKSLN